MLELNESQRIAAEYDGPEDGVLVLAGAGCGKTRTMVARALFLLDVKKVRPERLGMLTFTRRAAREIEERLELELPGRHRGVFVGTFHRFCLNLIHRYPQIFGYEEVKILDRSDEETVLRRIRNNLLKASGYDIKDTGILPKEGAIASVISYISNTCSSLEDYYEKDKDVDPETPGFMQSALREYSEYKREGSFLDFDDILEAVATKLEADAEFRERVQWLFEYILVDEMQDTSPVQWKILRQLYPKVKLFCVGDDAQSIYGFRGADFESVHHFCERLPNSTILKLTENYRSNQEILDAANVLLADSRLGYNRELQAHKGGGKPRPQLMNFYSEGEEAIWLVNMIADKVGEGVPLNEILVLMRSVVNGRRLEAELLRFGIRYRIVGGNSLLKSAHVKDMISILQALTDPKHEIAWTRFLTLFPKMGEKTAQKIHRNALEASGGDVHAMLAAITHQLQEKAPAGADLTGTLFDADALPQTMLRTILSFMDTSGIFEKKYDHWQERRQTLEKIVDYARAYEDVRYFLEAFNLDPDAEVESEEDRAEDVLTLSTVHGAKGTEADVVVVMHVQAGNYPHYRSVDEWEKEEERRILYVAMTRARKELYLTMTQEPGFTGMPTGPSPFLTRDLLDSLKIKR